MAEAMWLVIENGTQLDGQYSDDQVVQMLNERPSSTFYVWKAGMTEWADARTLPEFKAAAAPPAPPPPVTPPASPVQPPHEGGGAGEFLGQAARKLRDTKDPYGYLPHLKLIDSMMGWFAGALRKERLDSIDEVAKKIGHISFIITVILIFVFGVILGIKTDSFSLLYLLVFPIAVIAQYVAMKFLGAGKTLIEKSPSSLSSKAYLDCFALLMLIFAISSLAGGFVTAIQAEDLIPLAIGVGVFLVTLYILGASVNPSVVNVAVERGASAGQEAIGILSFGAKLYLRLVPFFFGVANVLGTCMVLYFIYVVLTASNRFVMPVRPGEAILIFTYIFYIQFVPFVAYLLFLVYYLLIDLVQAVLVLPDKVDRINAAKDDEAKEESSQESGD